MGAHRPFHTLLGVLLGAVILVIAAPIPSQAHWADLAVAEIVVEAARTEINLTFPTGLVAFADSDRDGRLSATEIRAHRVELEAWLGGRIRLTDGASDGALTVAPVDTPALLQNAKAAPGTHSSLRLVYAWPRPIQALTIRYGLFLPGVSTASCLATILSAGQVRSFIFTPGAQEFSFSPGRPSSPQQISSVLLPGLRRVLAGYRYALPLVGLLVLAEGLRRRAHRVMMKREV